jgi:hypothetical protein
MIALNHLPKNNTLFFETAATTRLAWTILATEIGVRQRGIIIIDLHLLDSSTCFLLATSELAACNKCNRSYVHI